MFLFSACAGPIHQSRPTPLRGSYLEACSWLQTLGFNRAQISGKPAVGLALEVDRCVLMIYPEESCQYLFVVVQASTLGLSNRVVTMMADVG